MRITGPKIHGLGTRLIFTIAVILSLALTGVSSHAATVRVPADQPTIQAGINIAAIGDTVLVAAGIYTGVGNRDITFGGKGIVLKSESGPANTIIDCQGLGRAFVLRGSVIGEPVIDGFTIINGDGGNQGGAIECFGFSPTIRYCVIADNEAKYGGALYFNGEEGKSAPEISSFPVIENCTFVGNTASAVGSVFFSNHGVSIVFSACLLSDNMSAAGAPVSDDNGGGTITFTCCDLWGNIPGDWIELIEDQAEISDNFSLLPVLCAPDHGFYGIHETSPLRPENSPCGQLVGAIGVSCDDCFDFDSDGLCTIDDNCPYHYNPDQQDTDTDGVGDVCEDDDSDGVVNADDNCPGDANSDQADLDQDGLGDLCDDDIDGDGVYNESDNCPFHYNPDQVDSDQDGTGDACQDDDDDGVLNGDDNCPTVSNPDQEDMDQDGIGDVCDDDIDGDGVLNESDNCPEDYNPDQADFDGDGVGDLCCCIGHVGDANGIGGDEPTIGDVSTLIDAKFITGRCAGLISCLAEADINQSGGCNPTCMDITIGDIASLIDCLFIAACGPFSHCLECP